MHVVIGLAHVGFCKDIGQIAYGLLHQHSTYVAELCASVAHMHQRLPSIIIMTIVKSIDIIFTQIALECFKEDIVGERADSRLWVKPVFPPSLN